MGASYDPLLARGFELSTSARGETYLFSFGKHLDDRFSPHFSILSRQDKSPPLFVSPPRSVAMPRHHKNLLKYLFSSFSE